MINQQGIIQFEHVVCGGGLVGAIWALYLRRRSSSVAVFQSYYDLRKEIIPGGRSINLVLSRKALDALQQLSIKQQVIKNTIPIKGQAIHCSNGETVYLPYGLSQNQTTYCIARNHLSSCLLDIVENNNIPIFFQHSLANGNINTNQYIFKAKNDNQDQYQVKVRAKYMYGTDGAGSKTRDLLLNQVHQQTNIDWFPADYKQMFMPANQIGSYPLDPNWVHLWPRNGNLMMGHANANQTFSMTLMCPSKGDNSFEQINSQQSLETFFNKNFSDLVQKIPNVYLQFSQNPIGYLGTIRVPSWNYKDKLVLLGDAAHTICPFLWQAVNIGFDDCYFLDKMIQKQGFTQKAFDQYYKLQKPKADALAQLTINNYEVLAFLSNEKQFLRLKQVEKSIERASPDKFWSKYRMIFFSNKTYTQILNYVTKYKHFMEEVKKKQNGTKVQNNQIEQQINKFSM